MLFCRIPLAVPALYLKSHSCCFQKRLLPLKDVAGSQRLQLVSGAVLPWAAARKLLPGHSCVFTGASQRLFSTCTACFLGMTPSLL